MAAILSKAVVAEHHHRHRHLFAHKSVYTTRRSRTAKLTTCLQCDPKSMAPTANDINKSYSNLPKKLDFVKFECKKHSNIIS